ncbi:alpha-ketoglutarate-dependent dioxygenase AlkB [uncultured Shewanella sp.]|uniref:alpha-ketoglutarate-dependent dioxygenase AlkB family protein n=1 Tax=uncultured Shewanella sp. TaxID=173975 RepID=UPI0026252C49|nr:alpha-ketoglutarate-dependent dioxygenase AlkB [uncultured Shewanella sp.]
MKQEDLGVDAPTLSEIEPSQEDLLSRSVQGGAPYTLVKGYLNHQQQEALINESKQYPFSQPEVQVYGKYHKIPRHQVWFADRGCDYFYSGLLIEARPWPKYAYKLRQKLARDYGLNSNGVLVNQYMDGHDSMGWHSDDEPEIEPASDIASLTLGATRDFFIRHKQTQQKICLQLQSGDLLIMHWPMQKDWEHSLPKRLKVRNARINYTFRRLLVGFHQSGID